MLAEAVEFVARAVVEVTLEWIVEPRENRRRRHLLAIVLGLVLIGAGGFVAVLESPTVGAALVVVGVVSVIYGH